MIKISLKSIFFSFLSFSFLDKGFSPSDFDYSSQQNFQEKNFKNYHFYPSKSFQDFLKDFIFFSIDSLERKNINNLLDKTPLDMVHEERIEAARFCLEKKIPEDVIKKVFNFSQDVIENLKKIDPSQPLSLKMSNKHKQENGEEKLLEELEFLTNKYFPYSEEEKQVMDSEGAESFHDLDIFMEPMNPFLSEKERIQRAIFLLDNAYPRFLSYEQIADITHFDKLKIEALNSTELKEKQAISSEKENFLEKQDIYIFNDGKKEEIKKLLMNQFSVNYISITLHVGVRKIKKIAESLNINLKTFEENQIPKEKAYILKRMSLADSLEKRKERVRELFSYNIVSLEKIHSITCIPYEDLRKLAKKWKIEIKTKEIKYNIPMEERYLLEKMNPKDSQVNKKRRIEKLLAYNVDLKKISSIVDITTIKIKKFAEERGIHIEGKNKFKISDDKADLLIKMDRNIPLDQRRQRAKDLLLQKAPVLTVQEITHIPYKAIKKLAEEWKIPIRKNLSKFVIPHNIPKNLQINFSMPKKKLHLLAEMSDEDSKEEKNKRILELLSYKVPVEEISLITHRSMDKIKKLAKKYRITTIHNG